MKNLFWQAHLILTLGCVHPQVAPEKSAPPPPPSSSRKLITEPLSDHVNADNAHSIADQMLRDLRTP